MAQLRQDIDRFKDLKCEVVVVGPEKATQFADYWEREGLPFVGLPDPDHTVLRLYGQQVKLFKLGRMPAQVLVDLFGTARFVHYGHSMADIPENESITELIRGLDDTDRTDE